ncbi:MAG: saccharopine dehydrogenase family protein [Phycisphaerales bacterium]
MPRAIVLGAGMVGSVIAADLADDAQFEVTIADVRADALRVAEVRAKGRIGTIRADLADPKTIAKTVGDFDIVLGALASSIGFQTLRAVIEAGKNFCDICFMGEDALELDELAKQRGVIAVVDCGVAPGLSNMLAGYGATLLDRCEKIDIYVGGLPRDPRPPFFYKAAFSPHDVIEEYTRPARLVEDGKIVVREALSDVEPIELPGVGNLEAFNTDGLRSLIHTMDVPSMTEKTLRYPGHVQIMQALRDAGLFGREAVTIGDTKVRPLDVTSALLFPKWMYAEGEEDLTVMRIVVEGRKNGIACRHIWDLLDYYDRQTNTTSMSRTTAFPCAIVARLIANGQINQTGVIPPELLGRRPDFVTSVLDELARRGVKFNQTFEKL